MLNLIQAGTTRESYISPHFFDLVIADESHRSLYNVYQQVLDYFHAIKLGLTATPTDRIDHDTFQLFDCAANDPTFAYSYEEAIAHDPPYLCDFEVLKVRSKFQLEGIQGETLPDADAEAPRRRGPRPRGHRLRGHRPRAEGHQRRHQRPDRPGVHGGVDQGRARARCPARSIVFAISKAHARRLEAIFDHLYPEHAGTLARVLVSDDPRRPRQGRPARPVQDAGHAARGDQRGHARHRHRRPRGGQPRLRQAGLQLHQVLADDRPRDAGPPRRPGEAPPLVPREGPLPHHRLLGQLRLLQDDPQGARARPAVAAAGAALPEPARRARGRPGDRARRTWPTGSRPTCGATWPSCRPTTSSSPRPPRTWPPIGSDGFWRTLEDEGIGILRRPHRPGAARPLRRRLQGACASRWRPSRPATALLAGNPDAFDAARESLIAQVAELPLTVNLVAREKSLIEEVLGLGWWASPTDDKLRELAARLAPLMRFRQQRTDGDGPPRHRRPDGRQGVGRVRPGPRAADQPGLPRARRGLRAGSRGGEPGAPEDPGRATGDRRPRSRRWPTCWPSATPT